MAWVWQAKVRPSGAVQLIHFYYREYVYEIPGIETDSDRIPVYSTSMVSWASPSSGLFADISILPFCNSSLTLEFVAGKNWHPSQGMEKVTAVYNRHIIVVERQHLGVIGELAVYQSHDYNGVAFSEHGVVIDKGQENITSFVFRDLFYFVDAFLGRMIPLFKAVAEVPINSFSARESDGRR